MSDMQEPDATAPETSAVADIAAAEANEPAAATRQQVRREQFAVLVKSPGFIIGAIIVAFWVFAAVFPGLVSSVGPKDFPEVGARVTPGGDAFFGTDGRGFDVFARVIYGARPILIVAPAATAIAIVVGTTLGLLMGYYRGWVDEIISRFIEAILSIPVILMAILVVFTFGDTRPVIIGTIAVLFVPAITRTIRSAAIAEAQLDYVTSAKMRGESGMFIVLREILPNVTGLVVVELTVRLGYAVFTYATLAFLGFVGADLTDADWGIDVAGNYTQIVRDVWWPSIFPALAIASLVIGVNLVTDSIDKALKS